MEYPPRQQKVLKRVVIRPFEKFFQLESASGMLIFGATLLAFIIMNSPWGHAYAEFWEQDLGIRLLNIVVLEKPLHLWINDGLMAVFFFVIGLEIKRELVIGELNSLRKAALPVFAALGGMLFPICIFLFANHDPSTRDGWGIVMATDIAFALAIIKLLGNRIPDGLKILLTAFAIVDDIGAVIVVAAFYSHGLDWVLILDAAILMGILFLLASRTFYNKYIYIISACIVWFLFLKAGLHPTLAGILMAFTIPIRRKVNVREFDSDVRDSLDAIIDEEDSKAGGSPLLTPEQMDAIDSIEDLTDAVSSPLQHLEHKLHGWVAYVIMPLFALANAGFVVTTVEGTAGTLALIIGISLIAGNAIGVFSMTFLSVKLGIAELPEDVTWKQIIGISFLAGVGFTMSIFITNLAYTDDTLINASKLGIACGSMIAGLLGYFWLRWFSAEGK